MKSKLPSAQNFQDWIIDDVIPSIRKTDKYIIQDLVDRIQQLKLENQTLTTQNQTQRDTIENKDTVIHEKTVENKEQHDTINIKSEVVIPPPTNPRYYTYLLLIEISKGYKYVEDDPEHYKESQYITIRCQKRSTCIASMLARVQKTGNESNSIAMIVCMFLNQNAINYTLRLKEYGNLIKCKYNGITASLPESELKVIIYKLNAEKYPYGVKP